MSRGKPTVGDVVEILLPAGGVAFGRVLRDASIAVYRQGSEASPPLGSRDYLFVVGIYADSLRSLPVVAHDPSADPDARSAATRVVALRGGLS